MIELTRLGNLGVRFILLVAVLILLFGWSHAQAEVVRTSADKSVAEPSPRFAASSPIVLNFSKETVGADPSSFASIVGFWVVAADNGNKVLMADGSRWQEGKTSASLPEKMKALYGEGYAELLDKVVTYAYYPYAVAKGLADFTQGEISVRFKPLGGIIDRAAGILFNLKPGGDYLILRANGLEDNLSLYQVSKGQRTLVEWVKNVPMPISKKWHSLKLVVKGKQIEGWLDGKLYLRHTLEEPISGKVGVWSKADSVVYFDDFTVSPGNTP